MKAEAFDGMSRDLGQVSRRRSITRLLGGVAALGAAAVVGRGDVEAKKHKKRKATPGLPGPAGPAGPAGAPGTSVILAPLAGERSAVLGTAVETFVESIAECDAGSFPVDCGWAYIGNASDFEHTTTQVGSESLGGVGFCRARLRRTAAVGSAGGQILVFATCFQVEPSRNP